MKIMPTFGADFLANVLGDWSYWHAPPCPTVPRDALRCVTDWPPDLVWVVQGVRRCGKSTLLAQLIQHFALDPSQCFFMNFEDPRLSQGLDHALLDQIVAFAQVQNPHATARYFFFDEIQNIQGWERWLHRKVERPTGDRFIVTGSNAALLGGRLATALTGRHRTLELFPFNFTEYKMASGGATLEDFVGTGGFPRPLSLTDPAALLREYFIDIIERDVRRHVGARSVPMLHAAALALFESTGTETSLRKLAAIMDSTADTLRTYVDAFVDSYLVLQCPYFTFSERKRLVRPIKHYPIDLGLRDALLSTPMPDRGKKLETVVFHHLRRTHGKVFFWREKGEVDFVVMQGNRPVPIQVTWGDVKDRHHAALAEFAVAFPGSADPLIIMRSNVEDFLERR